MDPPQEPANLRFLRRLVTVLTATMILGVLMVIVLLVIRLNQPAMALPDAVALPDGTTPTAFTRGPDWMAVTTDDAILIYGLDGELRQTVRIEDR
ncbi:MAG: DUF6476 family protein [Pseudomonadota bacterium]